MGGMSAYTMDEVKKHTTKGDCWVVVSGQVLDVTKFLGEHPGGELAILTFAGKDATEEKKAKPAKGGGLDAPLLDKGGHKSKNWKLAESNRSARMSKEGKIPGFMGALIYMVIGFMKEILFTIVPQKNLSLTNDRSGLTRSAMFLFIIIHAVGNLHVFLGPDDFNGYGYFYVRLYW